MRKSTFIALHEQIVDAYVDLRSSLPHAARMKCDGFLLNTRVHSFTEYLCATVYYLAHHETYQELSDMFGISRGRVTNAVHACTALIRCGHLFISDTTFLTFISHAGCV